MYFVYVLKSQKDKSLYCGYTKDVERRIEEHNSGSVDYTKRRRPWDLVYYEAFRSLEDAIERESKLKKFGKSYGQLKRRIERSMNI